MTIITEEFAIGAPRNFEARVLDSLRLLIERDDVFDEFEVHAMFDMAEEALADSSDEPQISAEFFAARIMCSAALVMSYGPGWRLLH